MKYWETRVWNLSVYIVLTLILALFSAPGVAAGEDKTPHILALFEKISAIPRCSGQEGQIRDWLIEWADEHELDAQRDQAGNLILRAPASPGYELAPTITLQGHLDMVCEKTSDSTHDFSTDPIRFRYAGEWLRADRTTLGADNGIGIALGLLLLTDDSVMHPALELLLTVEEETGLVGAAALESSFIHGRVLINLDSEREGTFTVGSAGGTVTLVQLAMSAEELPDDFAAYTLRVHGLRGGHSGVDIHEERGNANILLARALHHISSITPCRLIALTGGTHVGAIPREAVAKIVCDSSQRNEVEVLMTQFERTLRDEYAATERVLTLSFSPAESENTSFSLQNTENAIRLLLELPNGVASMSADFQDSVETSNNLGVVGIEGNMLQILSLQRGSDRARLKGLTERIHRVAAQIGANAHNVGGFSAWEPDLESSLLARCQEIYQQTFQQKAHVVVVHGGLECSVIDLKYPDLDMISVGPTIEHAHSPDERLHLPSVERLWIFLAALLASYAP